MLSIQSYPCTSPALSLVAIYTQAVSSSPCRQRAQALVLLARPAVAPAPGRRGRRGCRGGPCGITKNDRRRPKPLAASSLPLAAPLNIKCTPPRRLLPTPCASLPLLIVLDLDPPPVLLHILAEAHRERQNRDDRSLPLHARVNDPLGELQACTLTLDGG